MSPSREQIAEAVGDYISGNVSWCSRVGEYLAGGKFVEVDGEIDLTELADAVLPLMQPHTITSEAELDALPSRSVVLDGDGDPLVIRALDTPSEWIELPVTVLWSPEVTG